MTAETRTVRATLHRSLRSRGCQMTAVVVTFFIVASRHWHNDGLWFGDAPQHAINGLFWWDLLTTMPGDPMEFALRYYARYPVLNPVKYPPLFYLLEGAGFAVFGAWPQVAKGIVSMFAIGAGFYTMAWARRWIDPLAGWSGAVLAFVPGVVVLSNAVMLNVPALALGLAALYHLRRALETSATREFVITTALLGALLMTYYQGAVVVCICAAWVLLRWRHLRLRRGAIWVAVAIVAALVPVAASILVGPVHAARHLPSLASLTRASTWTFYWKELPGVVGVTALALGSAGLLAGVLVRAWRREALYMIVWIVVLIACVSPLPARDARYILLVAPAFVIAAAIGIAALNELFPVRAPVAHALALVGLIAIAMWSAARVEVPDVRGFREVTDYLKEHGPRDAVLYDGGSEGLFGFYLRAADPGFDRRMVRGDKLVYEQGPTTSFSSWFSKSNASSTDEVVVLVRERCGCQWVAMEVGRRPPSQKGRALLWETLRRSEFEHVASFDIEGKENRRVELFRLTTPVQPAPTVDLTFPSFTNRTFPGISPITR